MIERTLVFVQINASFALASFKYQFETEQLTQETCRITMIVLSSKIIIWQAICDGL